MEQEKIVRDKTIKKHKLLEDKENWIKIKCEICDRITIHEKQ